MARRACGCRSLTLVKQTMHGRNRFDWFENAMQFGSGLVFAVVGLVWCGSIDKHTTNWFGLDFTLLAA